MFKNDLLTSKIPENFTLFGCPQQPNFTPFQCPRQPNSLGFGVPDNQILVFLTTAQQIYAPIHAWATRAFVGDTEME